MYMLCTLIPNIGGPNAFKRIIISKITRSKLSTVYRLRAIRQINGFRTVSDEVVLVLAKTIPIDILANEMKRIFFSRLDNPGQIAAIKPEKGRASMHMW